MGPGPTRMRPGGTRGGQGNRPFAAGRPSITMGSYNRIVRRPAFRFTVSVQNGNHCSRWMARLYSSATKLRATWNSSRSPGNTWSASAREIPRRSCISSRILTSSCGSNCGRGCSPRKPSKTCARRPIYECLVTLRKDGIRQPERFGAFVNSTCNNVLQEFYRASSRTSPWDDSYLEMPDHAVNMEGSLVTKQMKDRVRQIIEELPKKDRDLLRAFFLEEKDKDEVCRQFGVDRDYLRVLLHRAKDKFRVLYEKDRDGLSGKVVRWGGNMKRTGPLLHYSSVDDKR